MILLGGKLRCCQLPSMKSVDIKKKSTSGMGMGWGWGGSIKLVGHSILVPRPPDNGGLLDGQEVQTDNVRRSSPYQKPPTEMAAQCE